MRLITNPSKPDIELMFDLYREAFGKDLEHDSLQQTFSVPGTFAIISDSGLCVASIMVDEAEIFYIGVKKNYRRIGAASKILKEALDYLKQKSVAKIFLEVSEENLAALELYKKFKFEIIGR